MSSRTVAESPSLRNAVSGLCELSHRLSDRDRALLAPALLILAESLAASSVDVSETELDPVREEFWRMQWQLRDRPPGEIQKITCARLKISKATYYRWQLAALEAESH